MNLFYTCIDLYLGLHDSRRIVKAILVVEISHSVFAGFHSEAFLFFHFRAFVELKCNELVIYICKTRPFS